MQLQYILLSDMNETASLLLRHASDKEDHMYRRLNFIKRARNIGAPFSVSLA
jgi:hypothetical protein